MKVYCGLCGQKAHELFTHIREVHEMKPDRYQQRCPQAPLISEDLARHIREENIFFSCEGIRKRCSLSGVEFDVPVTGGEFVPKVDNDYVLDKKLTYRLLLSLRAGEKALLVGPTGAGKSTLIEQIGARLNWPVVRVAASGGLTESDLLGEWTVRDGETVFNYGFLPRAMRMGALCLIDEIDGMEPSVAFAIHQLMEDEGRLVLLQNGGEIIKPHPRFRLIATANTLGHGDETGLYTGTHVLNEAFLDRFAVVFKMSYMDERREASIIRKRTPGCNADLARKMTRMAGEVREAIEQEELYCTFSTRRLIDFARKYSQLGDLEAALGLTVLNKLAGSDSQVVYEICQRHFGSLLEEQQDAQQNT